MYILKDTREKWVTLRGGLEFRTKCHINRKILFKGRINVFLGKMNGALEEKMEDTTVCDKVCLGVI